MAAFRLYFCGIVKPQIKFPASLSLTHTISQHGERVWTCRVPVIILYPRVRVVPYLPREYQIVEMSR
jgi:hypothetical protein